MSEKSAHFQHQTKRGRFSPKYHTFGLLGPKCFLCYSTCWGAGAVGNSADSGEGGGDRFLSEIDRPKKHFSTKTNNLATSAREVQRPNFGRREFPHQGPAVFLFILKNGQKRGGVTVLNSIALTHPDRLAPPSSSRRTAWARRCTSSRRAPSGSPGILGRGSIVHASNVDCPPTRWP